MNLMQVKYSTAIIFLTFLFTSSSTGIFAQVGRLTEDEIKRQGVFIEANKEKLMGRYDKAKELYLEIYREDRENSVIAYELAKVCANLDEPEESEKYIKEAIETNPSEEYYYRFYIDFLNRHDRTRELRELLEEVHSLYPHQERYAISLADIYAKNGQLNDAIAIYDELEKQNGIVEEIIREKFEWYDQLGDQKNAIRELEKLTGAYPGHTRYMNNLASYLMETGDENKAKELYKQVLAMDPENSQALLAITNDTRNNSGSQEEVFFAIIPIIQNPEIDLDIKIIELIPFVENLKPSDPFAEKLLGLLSDLAKIHPNEAKAHAIYGDALFNAGSAQEAIGQYKRTVELNPSIFMVWEQLMLALAKEKEYRDLAKYAINALDYYPNQAICYYYYGLSQYQLNQFREAEEYLLEGLIMSSHNPSLQYQIRLLSAKNSFAASELDKALEICVQLQDSFPDSNPDVYELTGDIYFQMHLTGQKSNSVKLTNDEDLTNLAIRNWNKAIETGGNRERIYEKIEKAQTPDLDKPE